MDNNKHNKVKKNNDECYTHAEVVEHLIDYIPENKIIWCPFDTDQSEFVKILTKHGFDVVYSHIDYGQNFYSFEPPVWDIMISNPPFSGKTEMFKRALSFNKPFCLLMTLTCLNDKYPAYAWEEFGKDFQLLKFDERMDFKNQPKRNINFSAAFFCCDFLPKQIIQKRLKENRNQKKLF